MSRHLVTFKGVEDGGPQSITFCGTVFPIGEAVPVSAESPEGLARIETLKGNRFFVVVDVDAAPVAAVGVTQQPAQPTIVNSGTPTAVTGTATTGVAAPLPKKTRGKKVEVADVEEVKTDDDHSA